MIFNLFRKIAEICDTPVFIYFEDVIKRNIERVKRAAHDADLAERLNIQVPYFTNSNPHIFRLLSEQGAGATLQAVGELAQLESFEIDISLQVSPTHLSNRDLDLFISKDILVYASTTRNLEQLLERGIDPSIRIDISADANQRSGIKCNRIGDVKKLLSDYHRSLNGISMYGGTQTSLDNHLRNARKILDIASAFPDVRSINLGGGFDFNYEETDSERKHFDWGTYLRGLKGIMKKLSTDVSLIIEPGRDVLADVGKLLVKINYIDFGACSEIYTDGSYVLMPSATIRARIHNLRFFDKEFNELKENYYDGFHGMLSGNTTLSSDRLFPGLISFPRELSAGGYVVLDDVGAYCATQHMEFLNQPPACETLVRSEGCVEIIAERGKFTDKTRYVPTLPRLMEKL